MGDTERKDLTKDGGSEVPDPKAQGIADTHERVKAIMDAGPFLKAIDALESRSDILKVIKDILERQTASREDQYSTLRGLFSVFFERLGENMSPDNWSNNEYMEALYALVKRYKEYFGDLVDETQYRDINLKIANALLRPFVLYSSGRDFTQEPLWVAEHMARRMDLAEEIHSAFPIDDIEKQRQNAKNCVEVILRNRMERWFYENPAKDDQGSTREETRATLRKLAEKFYIELPKEQEIWERDIGAEVANLSSVLSELEMTQKKNEQVFELDKKEKEIEKTAAFLREAQRKFNNLKLPEGFDIVQQGIDSFKNRLQAIIARNIEIIVEEKWKYFEEALAARDSGRIRNSLVYFSSGMDLPEDMVATDLLGKVVDRINKLKDEQVVFVRKIAADISADPEKAAGRLAEDLKTYGRVIEILNELIQKISKRIGKAV